MRSKRTIRAGRTGFQPVVPGGLSETWGVACAVHVARSKIFGRWLATKILRAAEFKRPEACSTPITA